MEVGYCACNKKIGRMCQYNCSNANVGISASGCRIGMESDAERLEANFGRFSKQIDYKDLQIFNFSVVSHTSHCCSSLRMVNGNIENL